MSPENIVNEKKWLKLGLIVSNFMRNEKRDPNSGPAQHGFVQKPTNILNGPWESPTPPFTLTPEPDTPTFAFNEGCTGSPSAPQADRNAIQDRAINTGRIMPKSLSIV